MPLEAAMGLLWANWSLASRRTLKLIDSVGRLGCCAALVVPAPLLGAGGCTSLGVRVTRSGLNWNTMILGRAPSKPAPSLMKAPFSAAIRPVSFLFHVHNFSFSVIASSQALAILL